MKLLRWMRKQDFSDLVAECGLPHGSLLKTVEHVVVDNHRRLHRDLLDQPWSPPDAYRWMRYENPDPVSQLEEATNSLERLWRAAATARPADAENAFGESAAHEEKHLAEVVAVARRMGFRG